MIENDLYRITFTNRGAQVKSWVLKKFDDEKHQPLDLVNSGLPRSMAFPCRCSPTTRPERQSKFGSVRD